MQEILKAHELVSALPDGTAPVDTTWDTAKDHYGRFSFNGDQSNAKSKHNSKKAPEDSSATLAAASGEGRDLDDDIMEGVCMGTFYFLTWCFAGLNPARLKEEKF
jgi:hypothetical protein